MPPLLSIENLVISYGNGVIEPVVNDISFSLSQGQCLGLIGESGCGKTTTARSISGLIPYQSGKILIKNQTVSGPTPSVQMVFQDFSNSLNPRMTILQNIIEPLRYLGVNTKEATSKGQALMEKVGISIDRSNDYPYSFSGGQLQRVSIARALAPEPDLVICDEPVSALDLSIQAQILELLKELQTERNFSLLFVSHDLSVVRYLCQESVVMHSGKILEKGITQDILDSPKDPITKALIEAIPGWSLNPN